MVHASGEYFLVPPHKAPAGFLDAGFCLDFGLDFGFGPGFEFLEHFDIDLFLFGRIFHLHELNTDKGVNRYGQEPTECQ